MEAKKLIRKGTAYTLYSEDSSVIASNDKGAKDGERLSTRNCQEVEHDIEKLFNEVDESIDFSEFCLASFRLGFLRRDEMLSDKRFTEEDVIIIAEYIRAASQSTPTVRTKDLFNEYQSIQPSDFECSVEVVTDSILVGQCNCRCHTDSGVMHFMACCHPKRVESPRFDSSGNLILMRILKMEELEKLEKYFVPNPLALRLKNLGFDEPCFGYRDGGGHLMIKLMPHCAISAPTFSQAFAWFRKTYPHIKFHFKQSDWKGDYTPFFDNNIKDEKNIRTQGCGGMNSHEEAELNTLTRLIDIVENEYK